MFISIDDMYDDIHIHRECIDIRHLGEGEREGERPAAAVAVNCLPTWQINSSPRS